MDNVILDNNDYSESSSEESEEQHYEMYSDNIGVLHDHNNNGDRRLLDMTLEKDYNDTRNKYFTPEILKTRILIDTNSIKDENVNTSEYTIYFKNSNDLDNDKSGFDDYQNVIGLKLTRALIYNTSYVVNEKNNKLLIQVSSTIYSIELAPGGYTLYTFREHVEEQLNNIQGLSGVWNFNLDIVSYKYNIMNTVDNFKLLWNSSNSEAYRLFGGKKIDDKEFKANNIPHVLDNIPQHNNTYVDVVIDEIPYIACKKNGKKLNIIDRVPMINENSELINYEPRVDNYNIYFHPINISQLTIKLYDETGNIYPNNNINNSFEFEITELKHINQ